MRIVVTAAAIISAAMVAGQPVPARAGDPQADNRGISRQSQVNPGDDRQDPRVTRHRDDQQNARTPERRRPATASPAGQPQPGASGARQGGASATGSSSATTGTPPSGTEAPGQAGTPDVR